MFHGSFNLSPFYWTFQLFPGNDCCHSERGGVCLVKKKANKLQGRAGMAGTLTPGTHQGIMGIGVPGGHRLGFPGHEDQEWKSKANISGFSKCPMVQVWSMGAWRWGEGPGEKGGPGIWPLNCLQFKHILQQSCLRWQQGPSCACFPHNRGPSAIPPFPEGHCPITPAHSQVSRESGALHNVQLCEDGLSEIVGSSAQQRLRGTWWDVFQGSQPWVEAACSRTGPDPFQLWGSVI